MWFHAYARKRDLRCKTCKIKDFQISTPKRPTENIIKKFLKWVFIY